MSAVVSDLDGTLVDTAAANTEAYAEAFARAGLEFDRMAYSAAFGVRFDELMMILAPRASALQVAAVRAVKADRYPAHFGLLRPNHGLIELLQTLRRSGVRVALASTATRANVMAVLRALQLEDLPEVIVTGDDVARGKPAPDCYLRAAALLGADPGNCLAVEDSPVGLRAARSAGYKVLEVRL